MYIVVSVFYISTKRKIILTVFKFFMNLFVKFYTKKLHSC